MNFLAHIFLAYPSEPLMVGNFIADFVKGKAYQNYPEKIQLGIIMHRQIDTFTDAHPIVKQSIRTIRPEQGRFSPVVIDMMYDHFLAANWKDFHQEHSLEKFTKLAYQIFDKNEQYFPDKVRAFFPYMKNDNWLLRYPTIEGLQKSLNGLYKRTGSISNMNKASETLIKNYDQLKSDFFEYFPLLQQFCIDFLAKK
ncbi:MAG: ACP phosphodiesterase [Thalassobius sp.]|nr:ACP phosphodiesterase [Thalassovita sp.]